MHYREELSSVAEPEPVGTVFIFGHRNRFRKTVPVPDSRKQSNQLPKNVLKVKFFLLYRYGCVHNVNIVIKVAVIYTY
jgi:hypothetical protein